MVVSKIDGEAFKNMIISAANNIENNRQAVNELNVFPVPDGDTGTNMSLTMSAAAKVLKEVHGGPLWEIAEKTANALLRGARGNSGVILSLLFRGFSRSVKKKNEIDGYELACALDAGVEMAYKAVMKPTEGTILTVARVSAEKGIECADKGNGAKEVLKCVIKAAEDTLQKTPDMLPVLKQAGVVDAGGKGLLLIYKGAYTFASEGRSIELLTEEEKKEDKADFGSLDPEDIKFAYCTEFIIIKQNVKNNRGEKLRSYLESIGDSVVVVEDDNIIKVHVHTNNPGRAIERAISISPITNIKIDNMKQQNTDLQQKSKDDKPVPKELKEFGFVAVSCGKGLSAVFNDIGVDTIVEGGQTMNPSTDDILLAVGNTPAKTVFVLPNNKNIIMAAEQASEICKDKNIIVIPSKTIPQGITAMLNFSEGVSKKKNRKAMQESLSAVKTAQITFAARDSSFDGKNIKQGQYMGLDENKVSVIGEDIYEVAEKLILSMANEDSSIITIYYGSDVTKEDCAAMEKRIAAVLPDMEISILNGGQPVYYYIISIE